MVKSPVGPPGSPPVPTVGAGWRGSLPGRKVWAVAADSRTMVASAAKSALLASLIAFLLRNEVNFCGRGRPGSPKSRERPAGVRGAAGRDRATFSSLGRGRSNYKRKPFKSKKLLPPANSNVL